MTCKETQFAQALLNADALARARGDRFGLCDCVDTRGNPYPSQWLADLLIEAADQMGLKPQLREVEIVGQWLTARQWPQRKGGKN